MRKTINILIFFVTLSLVNDSYGQKITYPATKKISKTDVYFGTTVADPYQWLEDDRSKETETWVEEQNAVTSDYFSKIPFRENMRGFLKDIYNYPKYSAPSKEGEYYFFFKNNGLQNQSVLYMQKGFDGSPEILIDPNSFSKDGTVKLGLTSFSKDGKYLAYSISRSGSDWQEIYVLDLKTKTKLSDSLNWVKFSGASWRGNGFYYSRYSAPKDTAKIFSAKNEFHSVYFHKLGDDQSRDELIYRDKEPLIFFSVSISDDDKYLYLFGSGQGSGSSVSVLDLSKGEKEFRTVIATMENRVSPIENIGTKIIFFTNKNAPNGKLVVLDGDNPAYENAKDFVAEQPFALTSAGSAGGKLFLSYLKDVAHHVYVYDLNGKYEHEIELPGLGTVSGFGGKNEDKETFYTYTSFIYPPTIFKYDIASKKSIVFRKAEIKFNPDDYLVKQVFYSSKDGAKIPMFIVCGKQTKLDGNNPTILYAYGGFNIGLNPFFSSLTTGWLKLGGVYVVANLRGGNEYGEDWHNAGKLLKKQNVFDDFIGAAEFLIKEKYTSPARLTIQGGSNGGLLVGAVINQRSDLFRVAVPEVGVMDMLKYEKFTIGWNWASEYGSIKDSANFLNLFSYSPLHNIKTGVDYPSVLVTTADHDDRVVPAHSFKYISTLQEKYKGNNPVLIRIETKSGHGSSSTTKAIEKTADIYSFILFNLGITPKF